MLAGKCGGPRKRHYNSVPAFVLSNAEADAYFAQGGAEGGFEAAPIAFAEYRADRISALPEPCKIVRKVFAGPNAKTAEWPADEVFVLFEQLSGAIPDAAFSFTWFPFCSPTVS